MPFCPDKTTRVTLGPENVANALVRYVTLCLVIADRTTHPGAGAYLCYWSWLLFKWKNRVQYCWWWVDVITFHKLHCSYVPYVACQEEIPSMALKSWEPEDLPPCYCHGNITRSTKHCGLSRRNRLYREKENGNYSPTNRSPWNLFQKGFFGRRWEMFYL